MMRNNVAPIITTSATAASYIMLICTHALPDIPGFGLVVPCRTMLK